MRDLEARGIDIDLRIIGFDLSDAAARSFEGVGTFENARNTEELAAALGRAVEEVVTVEAEQTLEVSVSVTREGAPALDGVSVAFESDVTGEDTAFQMAGEGELKAQLSAGAYSATVLDAYSQEPLIVSGLTVLPDQLNSFSFELAAEHEVSLSVTPTPAPVGSEVTVTWSGAPVGSDNWITIVPAGAEDRAYADYFWATEAAGSDQLLIGGREGEFEARFHLDLPEGGTRIIGRSDSFSTYVPEAGLSAPDEVVAGSTFSVEWSGPDAAGDYITIVPAATPPGVWDNYTYTRQGSPLDLLAQQEAGEYELRYVSGANGELILASRPITLVLAEYSVEGPSSAAAASVVQVHWVGPANSGDFITAVPADSPEGFWMDYAYVDSGNPVELRLPAEPGEYEFRYASGQGYGTEAYAAVTITEAEASVEAPATVTAGGSFLVTWTGPDGNSDYLTIVPVGAAENAYLSYAYTRSGSPATLVAPEEPGEYEVRYVASVTGDVVLASARIDVQ